MTNGDHVPACRADFGFKSSLRLRLHRRAGSFEVHHCIAGGVTDLDEAAEEAISLFLTPVTSGS